MATDKIIIINPTKLAYLLAIPACIILSGLILCLLMGLIGFITLLFDGGAYCIESDIIISGSLAIGGAVGFFIMLGGLIFEDGSLIRFEDYRPVRKRKNRNKK